MVWPGEVGVRWVGEAEAGVVIGGPRLGVGGVKRFEWTEREEKQGEENEASEEEEDVDSLEAEMEALEVEKDVYTRTSRLFTESGNETSARNIATQLDRVQQANLPPPPPHPFSPINPDPRNQPPRQPRPQPQPHLWVPAPAPEPPSPSQRPGPSSTQRPRGQTTDEIMRHLVGGMAGLAIPMARDDGGRWRISHRRK